MTGFRGAAEAFGGGVHPADADPLHLTRDAFTTRKRYSQMRE
jgi:hypothetical protein